MTAISKPAYQALLDQISSTYTQGRVAAVQAVNSHMSQTYWQVGKHIVEFEQGGKARADYGKALVLNLARDLGLRHGKGFSRTNLVYMRLFYQRYPISQTLSDLLGWSHIVEIIKIDDPLERGFYEQQSLLEKWSVRELCRQKNASLFLRLAAGQDKIGILQLAAQGKLVETPAVDLVFYHRILRCFVLIDLKIKEVQHQDIGQMNMYLGYFATEENAEGDNPPIGMILSRNKDELLVEYATYQMNSQLFVQKYQLYLPERDELQRGLEQTLRLAESGDVL